MKVALLICTFVAVALAAPKKRLIDTVPELDVPKYLGQWKQTFGNRYGWFTYGDDAVCITATYGLIDSQTVSVYNANRVTTGNGEERTISGEAYLTDEPGKLLVQLNGVPFLATYWVIRLGPADFGDDNLYQYAVVTNEDSTSLFVLTRDVEEFKVKYEEEVLIFLNEQGFTDYWTRPIANYHGADCIYPQ